VSGGGEERVQEEVRQWAHVTSGVVVVTVHRCVLTDGSPICCYYDQEEAKYITKTHHGKETVYVDNVRLCAGGAAGVTGRACVTFRLPVSLV
jgi:hypothetical protein